MPQWCDMADFSIYKRQWPEKPDYRLAISACNRQAVVMTWLIIESVHIFLLSQAILLGNFEMMQELIRHRWASDLADYWRILVMMVVVSVVVSPFTGYISQMLPNKWRWHDNWTYLAFTQLVTMGVNAYSISNNHITVFCMSSVTFRNKHVIRVCSLPSLLQWA